MTRRVTKVGADARGATIVEFAIVLPIMLLAIMGLMELCYQFYVQSILTGAVQKAGRDSAIQNNLGSTATIDAGVLAMVRTVAPQAAFVANSPTRTNFTSFQQVSRTSPEPFVDANGNKQYDKGECFDDINGNGVWDSSASSNTGVAGTGGASDVVSYSVNITYQRLFPLAAFIGWSNTVQLGATTMLRNQPFASQTKQETTICS